MPVTGLMRYDNPRLFLLEGHDNDSGHVCFQIIRVNIEEFHL